MQTLFTALYNIDTNNKDVVKKDVLEKDAITYTEGLIWEILKNPNRKQYKIRSIKTEIVSTVLSSVENATVSEPDATLIAQRLLNKEIQRQEEIDRLKTKIKQGGLLISLVKEQEYYYFVLVKVENNDYLDDIEIKKRTGLPYENKSFKQCLFKISEDENEISEIFLFDRNGPIADYWANEFLELDVLTSDEESTKDTFNMISNTLKRKMYNASPTDYILFRNQALGYYLTSQQFKLDDFFDYVFGSYVPECDVVNVEEIKTNLRELFENKKLDTNFDIIKSAIKSRKLKEIRQANPVIAITIDGYDADIRANIQSKIFDGQKYIVVKATDQNTYDSFKWQ